MSDIRELAKSMYGEVFEAPDCKQLLCSVLAMLMAQRQGYHSSHWQASGQNAYSDHQLFERLYYSVGGEIDTLAEKLTAKYGPACVDAAKLTWAQADKLDGLSRIADPVSRALTAELALQGNLRNAYDTAKAMGELTLGLDDLLMSIASNHESNIYLLQQRLGIGDAMNIHDLASRAVELAKSCTAKMEKSQDDDKELSEAEAQKADDKQAVKDLKDDGMSTEDAKDTVLGDQGNDDAGDAGDDDDTEDFGKSLAVLAAQGRVGDYRAIVARRAASKRQAELAKSRAAAEPPSLPHLNFQKSPDCDPLSIRFAPDDESVGYLVLGLTSGSGLYHN